jgi:hypothetical protein
MLRRHAEHLEDLTGGSVEKLSIRQLFKRLTVGAPLDEARRGGHGVRGQHRQRILLFGRWLMNGRGAGLQIDISEIAAGERYKPDVAVTLARPAA